MNDIYKRKATLGNEPMSEKLGEADRSFDELMSGVLNKQATDKDVSYFMRKATSGSVGAWTKSTFGFKFTPRRDAKSDDATTYNALAKRMLETYDEYKEDRTRRSAFLPYRTSVKCILSEPVNKGGDIDDPTRRKLYDCIERLMPILKGTSAFGDATAALEGLKSIGLSSSASVKIPNSFIDLRNNLKQLVPGAFRYDDRQKRAAAVQKSLQLIAKLKSEVRTYNEERKASRERGVTTSRGTSQGQKVSTAEGDVKLERQQDLSVAESSSGKKIDQMVNALYLASDEYQKKLKRAIAERQEKYKRLKNAEGEAQKQKTEEVDGWFDAKMQELTKMKETKQREAIAMLKNKYDAERKRIASSMIEEFDPSLKDLGTKLSDAAFKDDAKTGIQQEINKKDNRACKELVKKHDNNPRWLQLCSCLMQGARDKAEILKWFAQTTAQAVRIAEKDENDPSTTEEKQALDRRLNRPLCTTLVTSDARDSFVKAARQEKFRRAQDVLENDYIPKRLATMETMRQRDKAATTIQKAAQKTQKIRFCDAVRKGLAGVEEELARCSTPEKKTAAQIEACDSLRERQKALRTEMLSKNCLLARARAP